LIEEFNILYKSKHFPGRYEENENGCLVLNTE